MVWRVVLANVEAEIDRRVEEGVEIIQVSEGLVVNCGVVGVFRSAQKDISVGHVLVDALLARHHAGVDRVGDEAFNLGGGDVHVSVLPDVVCETIFRTTY